MLEAIAIYSKSTNNIHASTYENSSENYKKPILNIRLSLKDSKQNNWMLKMLKLQNLKWKF